MSPVPSAWDYFAASSLPRTRPSVMARPRVRPGMGVEYCTAGRSGNAGWLFTAGEPGVPELQTNVLPAVWDEAGSASDDDAPGVLGVVVEHARVGVDGEVDVALLNIFHRLW